MFTNMKDELKERFQEDYPMLKKYIIVTNSLFLFYCLFTIVLFSSFGQRWIGMENGFRFFIPVFMIFLFIEIVFFRRKIPKMSSRLKRTKYIKFQVLSHIAVLFILFGFIFFQNEQTIPDAIEDFGQQVEQPTYFPFEVKETSGNVVYEHDYVLLTYASDDPSLNVYISTIIEKNPRGEEILLNNGIKAWYIAGDEYVDRSLQWESKGLWYDLRMYKDYEEYPLGEYLKVANSFRH